MTFAAVEVTAADVELLDALYAFGVANPLRPELACTPHPHPLRSDWIAAAEDPDRTVLAVYDNGELRAGMAFTTDGVISVTAIKTYTTPGQAPVDNPRGVEFATFLFDEIRARCGRVVSPSKNPNTADVEALAGAERETDGG